jgi:hypothetical protein
MIVYAFLPDAALLTETLKVELYAVGPGTIVNGTGGDTLTAVSGQPGWYSATIAETLTGLHRAVLTLDGSPLVTALTDLSLEPPIFGEAPAGVVRVSGFDAQALTQLAAAGIQVTTHQVGPTIIRVHVGADHNATGGSAWEWTNKTGVAWASMLDSTWSLEIHDGADLAGTAIIALGTVSVLEADFASTQRIRGQLTAVESAKLRRATRDARFFVYQAHAAIGKQLRAWGTVQKVG